MRSEKAEQCGVGTAPTRPSVDWLGSRRGGWIRVVAGAVADVESIGGGAGHRHLQAMEIKPQHLVVGIIAEQVLRAQVVAHLGKGLVESAFGGVEAFAAGLFGKRDQGVFSAQVAAGAGLDGHIDD